MKGRSIIKSRFSSRSFFEKRLRLALVISQFPAATPRRPKIESYRSRVKSTMASAAAKSPSTQDATDVPSTQEEPLTKGSLPKPYWALWNPNLPWMDLFICFLLSRFLPFSKLAKYDATSKEACTENDKFQEKFFKTMKTPFQQACRHWSKACGGLVQCTWQVPRRPSILYEWGIIDKEDPLMKQVMEKSLEDNDVVKVNVWCPASLVLKKGDEAGEQNDCGCIEVETVNIKDIPQDVPIVLWFHGGGLTLGTSNDAGAIDRVNEILTKQKKGTDCESVPPLLLASVDYRLAPKHPLPAASIDALSVLDYSLKNDPGRMIHVAGESAGGYLSLVSAFAGHRHFPGRIHSALVLVPFISPAADSMSIYMNGPSSKLVEVSWLRWCWRAALEMKDSDVVESDDNVLAIGSNRTAWNKSKWKQNEQWQKFLEPMAGIPPGLDDKEKRRTKYIVAVNKADPLYDEGKELATMLKEHGADVDYLEALGSHSIGFQVDKKAYAELMELWRSAIFEKSQVK